MTAAPGDENVWLAYLDYVTYGVSAVFLLGIVRRVPAAVRPAVMPRIMAVCRGRDRWSTMPDLDQSRFQAELPALLEALDDQVCLGGLYSESGLAEHRSGSHDAALVIMRRAVATGHPTLACVDRVTIDLMKLGELHESHAILTRALADTIASDSLRDRLDKRLSRCERGAASAAKAQEEPRRNPTLRQ